MFEQITLSLARLAVRWDRTPGEILEISIQRGLPLYFWFDGLVFNIGDEWLRSNGDWQEARNRDELKQSVKASEDRLQKNALRRRGELKTTEWDEVLSSADAIEIRASIDADTKELRRLSELLDQRDIERNQCRRNGLLRAAPVTLQAVMEHGTVPFPIRAYDPNSPVRLVPLSDGQGQGVEGRMLTLEDARRPKEKLTADDLFASMIDIKAIESAQSQVHQAVAQPIAPMPPARNIEEVDASQNIHWKLRVQAQAATMFLRAYKSNANPTVANTKDDLARWCRENDVTTDTGVFPNAEYLRTHVLSGQHWKKPDRPRKLAEQTKQTEQVNLAQAEQQGKL